MALKSLHRPGCRGLRQIEKGQIADQNHLPLILHGKHSCRGRIRPLGQSQHPQALFVEHAHAFQHLLTHFFCQRHYPALLLRIRADLEHFLCGSLGNHLPFAASVLHHDAHAPALKIKGNLIHLRVSLFQIFQLRIFVHQCLSSLDDRPVQQVPKARLVPAVQKRVAQDPVVLLSVHIQMTLQYNLILSQGPGLVCTQDVHGAQVLDRVQLLHNDLMAAHGYSAPGQAGSHDHRKHLRRQADGDGNGKENRVQPVSLHKAVQQQNHRHHEQHQPHQQPGHGIHPLFKGGLCLFFRKPPRHASQDRAVSHCGHDASGAPADHTASRKGQAALLKRRNLPAVRKPRLLHRLALPGQGRLADEEILRLQDPQIRRDHIARRQVDHVPHHELF